ncbi:MAG: hypothetical protein ACPGXK_05635 [Phycisphaerae bacterium]
MNFPIWLPALCSVDINSFGDVLAASAGIPGFEMLYWACAVAGGGLLMFSLVFGGSGADADTGGLDLDFDGDVDFDIGDVEIDADAVAGAEGLDGLAGHGDSLFAFSTWFSTRFLVNFAAAFGIVGVLLSTLSDMQSWWVFGWSMASGIVTGQIVHQTSRYLQRTSGNSQAKTTDYINRPGRVTIGIQSGRMGEVAVNVKGTDCYLPAVAQHPDHNFASGDAVTVVRYGSGVATVVSQREYEFLNER